MVKAWLCYVVIIKCRQHSNTVTVTKLLAGQWPGRQLLGVNKRGHHLLHNIFDRMERVELFLMLKSLRNLKRKKRTKGRSRVSRLILPLPKLGACTGKKQTRNQNTLIIPGTVTYHLCYIGRRPTIQQFLSVPLGESGDCTWDKGSFHVKSGRNSARPSDWLKMRCASHRLFLIKWT